MKKLFTVSSDSDNVNFAVRKRPLYFVRNILLELFLIGSVYAPWYTNAMWCFGAGREPALGTFMNTLYFFGAVLLFAFLADKWWNIPCGIYMLLMAVGSAVGIIAPSSALYEGFNFLVLSPMWGLYFFAPHSNIWSVISLIITVIFSVATLWIMLRKYIRKEQKK